MLEFHRYLGAVEDLFTRNSSSLNFNVMIISFCLSSLHYFINATRK